MGETSDTSLGELNDILTYDLKDKLLSYYGNDPNANPYLELNLNSRFHDPSSFIDTYLNSSQPIYLNVNVRSLQANHSALLNLVQNFQNANVPIDIIAVQEIWQIPHPEIFNIPNFSFIFKQRSIGKGGGVGFYVNTRLNFKIRDDLSFFIDKVYESLTVEIINKNSKFYCTNIYRSPTPPFPFDPKREF